MYKDIPSYLADLTEPSAAICKLLQKIISENLPDAESKIWHKHPVWFLEGNPVVGYAKLKNDVQLLFWSGASFTESGLEPEGSYKAAQKRYTDVAQINLEDLKRWLKAAREIQWDYKNIVKNRGQLNKLNN